jgi:glycosyltransferase involved in cell wall biosynthesis
MRTIPVSLFFFCYTEALPGVRKMVETITNKEYNTSPFVIALIPAYNESKNIGPVISEAIKCVSRIIVVDDGSTDNTKEAAESMSAMVIRNKRNMGKGFALKRGLIECLRYNPDIVVTIDADGQHDPSEIPLLLAPILSEEADVVIGSRYEPGSVTDAPVYRKAGLYLLNNLNRILVKTSVKDAQSGYKAYSKNVLSTILKYDSSSYGVEVEQLAALEAAGFRVVEVPVTIRYEGLGITSKNKPLSDGYHILSSIFRIAIEKKPLLFFGVAGMVMLVAALVPAAQIVTIFNETRYFSLPLAMISAGFLFLGSMLILMSLIFFALRRIRQREDIIATTLLDLLNKMKQ